ALSHLISTAKAFEEASGLMVNFEKSSVAFSRNTSNYIRAELVNILGICEVDKHEKYFGLPALMGHSKRDIFQDMKDKVWKRLQSWKCINLSQAGKLVLLKSIVEVMPTFVMGCFLILTTLCLELRDFPHSDVFQASAETGCSFTWRSILAARDLFILGLRWHIGTGQNVCIWKDRWIPRPWKFQTVCLPSLPDALPTSCKLASRGVLVEELVRGAAKKPNLETWFRGVFQYLDRSGFARALLICWAVYGFRIRLLFENNRVSVELLERVWIGTFSLALRPDFAACSKTSIDQALLELFLCWAVWGSRIRLLFENSRVSAEELLERVWGLEHSLSRTSRSALDLRIPSSRRRRHLLIPMASVEFV
ncbi:hypothetical protein Sango_3098600, partial [Sesamum angolense]